MPDRPVVRIATYGLQQRWSSYGSWAAVVYRNDVVTTLSGHATGPTTQNRMAFRAILEGLSAVKHPADITIQTDVELIFKALNHDWKLIDATLLIYYHEIMAIIENPDLDHRIKVVKVPTVVVSVAKQAAMKAMTPKVAVPSPKEQPQLF